MIRSSSLLSSSSRQARTRAYTTPGVTDFLRAHDRMASILPAVARLATLQKDCAALLPALFDACFVMQFDAGQLVLGTPNAALATKLKQQLPKLQDHLQQRGWQVSAIRLKVQVGKISEKSTTSKRLLLPDQAFSALADLKENLEDTPRNTALKAALDGLLNRHRKP